MEQKAQGAIEYLLIIVAAVLVVALVVYVITSVMSSGGNDANSAQATEQKQTNTLKCQADVTSLLGTGCTVATAKANCTCCTSTALADSSKIPACK